ncbi:DUF3809 domain-containing protein [Marinithermus hydrothermalis]|uniref:Polyketide cyclase/dehydrase n=1 Tax=Marinithermus hydrothermalis (strain DSM 14884 / JCM 11576 / T1) TaxID=869210 RepID=F2NK95_MARHT|nr:DUF3809 domain-containing protein [Marinithermus hydrothermalis]AEB12344.1 hypothetical protein Marky_1609 [Marinithermus hydrothermalis DSM 14884]
MVLEREIELNVPFNGPLQEAKARLLAPEVVFAPVSVLKDLRREGTVVEGRLSTSIALFGEVSFPFRSQLRAEGEAAVLEALPLEAPFWAELSGRGEARGSHLHYRVRLRVHAEIPEGEKWGGRAFRRLAEATFQRTLERVLAQLAAELAAG